MNELSFINDTKHLDFQFLRSMIKTMPTYLFGHPEEFAVCGIIHVSSIRISLCKSLYQYNFYLVKMYYIHIHIQNSYI